MQLHGPDTRPPRRRSAFHRCVSRTAVTAATLVWLGAGAALAQNAAPDQGLHVFMNSHCFVCHGQMGYGGVGPKFRDDQFLGVANYVIAQILLGRGIMPAYADKLNDREIAAVASYIRNSWGNKYGTVKPEQVAEARKKIQQQGNQVGSSQPPPGSPAGQPAPQK